MGEAKIMMPFIEGCLRLTEAAGKLGNINCAMCRNPGDVPYVVTVLPESEPTIEVCYDGRKSYDVWTTGEQKRPIRMDLSLDEATELLVQEYVIQKRKEMTARFNASEEELDEYFRKQHNGYGVSSRAQ